MSAREALEIATRGGAQVLGRDDCGQIAIGKRADIAIWDTTGVDSAGSWDKAALLLAGPTRVKHLFVEGRQVVRDGQMATIDLPKVVERQNQLATALMG
jgi:cytosine/adenosine deaminase-related metal-dependent hydrolase